MIPTNNYTPFAVDFSALRTQDLLILRSVHEGWYIEYKRELPSPSAIAKSISAFANTYGGWLFFGITEKSKDDTVAGLFEGLDSKLVENALQSVRQASALHLSDTPFFNVKALYGPNKKLGLASDKAIVCVQVPPGANPPYVHSSGRIYRRVADSSEPRHETDRYVLDQLFNRNKGFRKSYKNWIKDDPKFPKSERSNPCLRILLVPDLWLQHDKNINLNLSEAREIFHKDNALLTNIPLNSVHRNSNGFTARQIGSNDGSALGLMWQYRYSLVSEIYIPIQCYQGDLEDLKYSLSNYSLSKRFINLLKRYMFDSPKVLDVSKLFSIICGVVEQHERLMERASWSGSYYAKVRLLNASRTIPFLNTEDYISDSEKHGPPLCHRSIVTAPSGYDPEDFQEILRHENVGSQEQTENTQIFLQALRLFVPVAQAFGITLTTDDKSAIDFIKLYQAANA